MRTDITHISIPTPCHEAWNKMTPSADGRFCGSCAKTVIDFSEMSADQIIAYLSTSQNTCGRFAPMQLISLQNQVDQTRKMLPKLFTKIALATTMLIVSKQAEAKNAVDPVVKEHSFRSSAFDTTVAPKNDTIAYRTVIGTVVDANDQTALPGVMVRLKGTQIATQTNAKGEFSVSAPSNFNDLIIAFIGYRTQEFKLNSTNAKEIHITLKAEPMILGEVIIIKKASLPKRIYYRYIKRPIKMIFG